MKKWLLLLMSAGCFYLFASQSLSEPKVVKDHKLETKADIYSGIDQRGHFFRGNSKTGFYFNYGTGETCYGLNKNRTCFTKKN